MSRIRRRNLDDEANRLLCMRSVSVYEVKYGWEANQKYYEIVWGGRRRWSVPFPWDQNKSQLREVGYRLRNWIDEKERLALENSEKSLEEQDEREKQDALNIATKESYRTLVEKPVYFYK